MQLIPCTSAHEFLDYLRLSQKHWHEDTDATRFQNHTGWVFRGQADASWNLLPKVFRKFIHERWKSDSFYANPLEEATTKRELIQCLKDFVHGEFNLVRQFLFIADEIGQQVPTDMLYGAFNEELEEALSQVNGKNVHFPDFIENTNYISAFSLAQHYNVPTRLLDWSFTPLVATYFAAYKVMINEDSGHFDSSELAVWALNADRLQELNTIDRKVVVISSAYAGNLFIKTQSGLFTYDEDPYRYYYLNGTWPKQNEVIEQTCEHHDFPSPLVKITLPHAEVRSLLRLLYREKISPAHIMPTLENVTKNIELHRMLFATNT